jgi:hypothetical protein
MRQQEEPHDVKSVSLSSSKQSSGKPKVFWSIMSMSKQSTAAPEVSEDGVRSFSKASRTSRQSNSMQTT